MIFPSKKKMTKNNLLHKNLSFYGAEVFLSFFFLRDLRRNGDTLTTATHKE